MNEINLKNNIIKLFDTRIKHLVEADGGKIQFSKLENNKVFVKMGGRCSNCPAILYTLKGSVERIVKMEFPEIISVELEK